MQTPSLTSSPTRLRGSQAPTRSVVPNFETSEWRECHALNAAGGLEMLEWQDGIMKGWLGRNHLGRWSAPTCAGSIPRQNGKSLGLVEARANYGMVVLGEQVIYTSHLQKTSTETFEDMANFFDQKLLRRYVKDIKTALGREQIILKNGGRIKFLARTRNGGRGQHGDLLIFDEALELDADSQASFLPAISASSDPQTIYVSTPPTAHSDGGVFRSIRRRALDGKSERVAWFEWGTDEVGDVTDRKRWYETNPSLGILIQESTVAGECEQMDADTFARERLGWWSSDTRDIESVISSDEWNACRNENPKRDGLVAYSVRFSADGHMGAMAACHRGPDGGVPFIYIVRVIGMQDGIGWFVDTIAENASKAASIVIDGKSNAEVLCNRLRDRGVSTKAIVMPTARDVIAANSMLLDAVRERRIAHYGQPLLDDSATMTTSRKIGSGGGWGFESTERAEAAPIEAAALAYWGAMTTKRKPGRRAVVRC